MLFRSGGHPEFRRDEPQDQREPKGGGNRGDQANVVRHALSPLRAGSRGCVVTRLLSAPSGFEIRDNLTFDAPSRKAPISASCASPPRQVDLLELAQRQALDIREARHAAEPERCFSLGTPSTS